MMESKREAFAGEIRDILAEFFGTARKHGKVEAQRVATCNLIAATAFLQESIGAAKTRDALNAAIASLDPAKGVH